MVTDDFSRGQKETPMSSIQPKRIDIVRAAQSRTRAILKLCRQLTPLSSPMQVTELQGNINTALALVMVIVVAAMGFRAVVIVWASPSLLFSIIIIFIRTA